jgi:hypothetical protein
VFEAHAEIRRIYLTDAANPEDLFPDRNGYSVGRWEGDHLIVETTHLKEAVDQNRYPHSENAKIVEEYSLEVAADGTKVLTAQMTMTDTDFYTQPITLIRARSRSLPRRLATAATAATRSESSRPTARDSD